MFAERLKAPTAEWEQALGLAAVEATWQRVGRKMIRVGSMFAMVLHGY